MKITSIRVIRPKDRTSPVLAYADVELSTGIQLRDMRLLRRRSEDEPPLLRMPSKPSKNGVSRDIYNPITKEAREELTQAVIKALQQAVEQNVNDLTVSFEEAATTPMFGNIHIHRFPHNRQLKAFASCVVDGEIALNRLAVVLDEETKALRLTMPNHTIVRTGGFASYYRMNPDSYKLLYEEVMGAYTAAAVEA